MGSAPKSLGTHDGGKPSPPNDSSVEVSPSSPSLHDLLSDLAAEADRLRLDRARLVGQVREARATLEDVISRGETDASIAHLKVLKVLEALPGAKKVPTRRRLRTLQISELATFAELTAGQRAQLLESFAELDQPQMAVAVLAGPGGVGKGTVAALVTAGDPDVRLQRSWTTRKRRPNEADDAYVFVSRIKFEEHIACAGFLEWAEFLGNLYGTPKPDPSNGHYADLEGSCFTLLLEIEVQGAEQVRAQDPSALVLFMSAPDERSHRERLAERGDDVEHIEARIAAGRVEAARARELGAIEVVNNDLAETVEVVRAHLRDHRLATCKERTGGRTPQAGGSAGHQP